MRMWSYRKFHTQLEEMQIGIAKNSERHYLVKMHKHLIFPITLRKTVTHVHIGPGTSMLMVAL